MMSAQYDDVRMIHTLRLVGVQRMYGLCNLCCQSGMRNIFMRPESIYTECR